MSQKTSPFVEAKWGWNFGESNWNTGADENWLKFSYLFDGNVDGIVDTLPLPAVVGTAYYLNSDKRIYFAVDGTYYSTPLPKWFQFKLRSDGTTYLFNGTVVSQILSSANIQNQLDNKEPLIAAGTTLQYLRGDKTFQPLNKAAVGLTNVDNTSDVNKPVSTAQQTALNLKAAKGANSDITSLSGLTTALSVPQGGTGGNDQASARTGLGLGNAAVRNSRAIPAEINAGGAPTTYDDGFAFGYNTPGANINGNGNGFNYYQYSIANDAAVQQAGVNGATSSKVSGINLLMNFGGPTARGGRHAVQAKLLQGFGGAGVTDQNNQDRFYVGLQGQVLSDCGDGGTGPSDLRGAYFGAAAYAGLYGSAKYVANITAAEFNTDITAGSGATAGVRVAIHTGVQVASLIGERGYGLDACFSGACLAGSNFGWKYGVAFHNLNGGAAFGADSTAFKIFPNASATATLDRAIDVTGITFTNGILTSTNVTLADSALIMNRANVSVVLGAATANTPSLQLRSSGTAAAYDVRVLSSGGTATAGNGTLQVDASGIILGGTVTRPSVDATQSHGTASFRHTQYFAVTGTIGTSDAREKTEVVPFSKDEMNAAKTLAKEIGTFKWLESVQAKGEDARKHIGLTVQRAIEVMEANNLDPMAYGFICYDEWDATEAVTSENEEGEAEVIQPATEAGSRYGFRMDQLNLFIAAGFEARLAVLEDK